MNISYLGLNPNFRIICEANIRENCINVTNKSPGFFFLKNHEMLVNLYL